MDFRASTSRYILTALAIILVITSFVLVGLNALHLEQRLQVPSLTSNGQDTVQAAYVNGYLAARKKYQTMCPFAAQETLGFSGTVQEISGSALKVSADSIDADPTVDGVDDVRTVSLASDATVQRNVQKSQAQFEQELSVVSETPPIPSTLTVIRLADIKPGDKVFVMSASDVRLAPSIVATSVIVE